MTYGTYNPNIPRPTYSSIIGKPYITVSAKGRSNGLSTKINDGADFGPDTTLNATNPNQTGPPYTQTLGIKEAGNYLISKGGGTMYLKVGVYDTTNAPFQSYINNDGNAQAKIVFQGVNPQTNPLISINIIGENTHGVEWPEVQSQPYSLNGTVLMDTTAGNSSIFSYILGIGGASGAPATQSNISVKIDGINVIVGHGNGIGGIDLKSSINSVVGILSLGVDQAWPIDEPTNPTQIGINLAGQYCNLNIVNVISCSGGLYNTIGLGHHATIKKLSTIGDLNSIYINNEIHEGIILSLNTEYTQNIFNVSSSYAGDGVISPLKIIEMSVANNNSNPNGSTWQNPVNLVNNPASKQIFPIFIDELWYYGGLVPTNYYPTQNFLYIKKIIYTNTTINSYPSMPTISVNPPVSGTVYQNINPSGWLNPYDIRLKIPVTYNPTASAAATLATGISPTSTVTTSTKVNIPAGLTAADGEILTYEMVVPAGWYYELVATNATIGTAEVQPA